MKNIVVTGDFMHRQRLLVGRTILYFEATMMNILVVPIIGMILETLPLHVPLSRV